MKKRNKKMQKMVQNTMVYGSWKDQIKIMDRLHRESVKKGNKRKMYAFGA